MDIWKKLPVISTRLKDNEQEIGSLRSRYEAQRVKLQKIAHLYEKRCEATVNDFTEDEELFLANISMVLNGEDLTLKG